MKIFIFDETSPIKVYKRPIQKMIKYILQKEQITTNEISIQFVGEQTIVSLHKKYFNNPYVTDCISLPIDSPYEKKNGYSILGEIVICSDTAKKYASKHRISLDEEVALYVIHSLLHLIGYDDIEEKDRKIMRKKEKLYIQLIKDRGALHLVKKQDV